jgi:hypothetical protein
VVFVLRTALLLPHPSSRKAAISARFRVFLLHIYGRHTIGTSLRIPAGGVMPRQTPAVSQTAATYRGCAVQCTSPRNLRVPSAGLTGSVARKSRRVFLLSTMSPSHLGRCSTLLPARLGRLTARVLFAWVYTSRQPRSRQPTGPLLCTAATPIARLFIV